MGKRTKEYYYKVGEVVNDTLKIVKQIRIKDGKSTCRGYLVKSLKFPNNKNDYEINEYNLKKGVGCAYVKGKRIIEENSLYSHLEIRDNLIDVEQAKKTPPYHNKPILFKCDNEECDCIKEMTPNNLFKQGFTCQICSKGTSYPELYFISYNGVKNAGFIPQQRFDDFERHIFDFVNYDKRIIVETHGMAHYQEASGNWKDAHKKTVASDKRKRKYYKDNNWTLIELDCRISSFEHIRNSIVNEPLLDNTTDNEVEDMLRLIEMNKRYPIKDMCSLYLDEMLTISEIANKLGFGIQAVKNALHRSNVKLRNGGAPRRTIKCIETGVIYGSLSEAMRQTGINVSSITKCCNGKQKTAGKLHWEYIDNE